MEKNRYVSISPQELKDVLWHPSIDLIVKETGSAVIFDKDEASAQLRIMRGDLTWFRYKLRDRRFDGPGWSSTPLTDWQYDKPVDIFSLGSAVEESVYCLDPRYPLTDEFTEDQAEFIQNPFEALPFQGPTRDLLNGWLEQWHEVTALKTPSFPGYFCLKNIPGVRRHIHTAVASFIREKGYKWLTAVPTWWHTASICEHLGFWFLYRKDRERMNELGRKLPTGTRSFSSWVVMLQFWAELAESAGFAPEDFNVNSEWILRDTAGNIITFPLSPERNLWQVYEL